MKVLLALNHAPDYREPFFRKLGEMVDLTVLAQPCSQDNLPPPGNRFGYRIFEIPTYRFKGLYWQPRLLRILASQKWDIVCFDLNPRQLSWITLFLTQRKSWKKWIWRGRFFGRNKSSFLNLFRKALVTRSAGCLTYNEPIAQRIRDEYKTEAVSFNNTQVSEAEFRRPVFPDHTEFHLLFVGRNQPRKKLHRLINLAARRQDVHVRLIGPGMENLEVPPDLVVTGRLESVGRTVGNDLNEHFDWADIVVNPGHVGLLVMNTAQHGKGIVIDAESDHAPEYWLAKEAEQPFIAFEKKDEVDQLIDDVLDNRWKLKQWGRQLQEVAKQKYTIEYMAKAHFEFFQKIAKIQ
jgi:glycosyltransferase involved in cell wall biosynthesis